MPSLRGAINAKCRDCIYDPAAPGTCAQQIKACTSMDCPLWPVRPIPPGCRFGGPILEELLAEYPVERVEFMDDFPRTPWRQEKEKDHD